MNDTPPDDLPIQTSNQQLALNVVAALLVAGPHHADRPSKLTPAEVMRRTQISRSTLRPLLDTTGRSQRNPDLGTLHKLAHAIGVPLAFLLMTPDDWRVLMKAINAINEYQWAADSLVTDEPASPELAEAVMKRCRVHPDRPPLDVADNPQEINRLDARNEWRRRCSLVMAALAQPAARGKRRSVVGLTALAAALANELTPNNPSA